MMKIFFLLTLFFTISVAVELPDACFTENELFPTHYGVNLTCYGGDLTEILEYVLGEPRRVTTLTIKNCRPRFDTLKKLPKMTVEKLTINNCGIEEVDDDAFENNLAVQELDLSNNLITNMPNLEKLLKNLKVLKLNKNKISYIPDDYFESENASVNPLPLKKLELSNNCLEKLPNLGYFFHDFEKLDFSYNKISYIPAGVFNKTQERYNVYNSELSLAHNQLTNLSDSVFAGSHFDSIVLAGNQISYISPHAFNSSKTRTINLESNKIAKLEPGTFASLHDFYELRLSRNQLNELHNTDFSPVKNIYLDSNGIKELPSDFFNGMDDLWRIDLSGNNLTKLSEGIFDKLNEAIELHLNGNQLKKLPPKLFHAMSSLKSLDLSDNELSELQPDLFPLSLDQLQLQNNHLKSLPEKAFSSAYELKLIDLRNNSLSTLSEDSFDELPMGDRNKAWIFQNLYLYLYLDGNPLVCDKKTAWIRKLFKINNVWEHPYFKPSVVQLSTCAAPPQYAGLPLKEVPQ